MSVRLSAPLPSQQTTTVLPNPQLADVERHQHKIDIFRAIDGSKRTSVKSNSRHALTYDFVLDRLKAEELKAFVRSYIGSKIRLVNHKSETFDGYLMNNPFEFAQGSRNGLHIQIQFEGDKQ